MAKEKDSMSSLAGESMPEPEQFKNMAVQDAGLVGQPDGNIVNQYPNGQAERNTRKY
jgi:hypothetical protein